MKVLVRAVLFLLFLTRFCISSLAQSAVIGTYVGPGLPIDGRIAILQAIDSPRSVAPDGAGGFYVACETHNRVYRVTSSNYLRLAAGAGPNGFSGDGGPATSAQLGYWLDVAVNPRGDLCIAVDVVELSADGGRATALNPIRLAPGEQKAGFFFQDPRAAARFKGSAVLTVAAGERFSAVALVQMQSSTGPIYSVLPVSQAKAPGIFPPGAQAKTQSHFLREP